MVALLYSFLFFIFQENNLKFIINNSVVEFFSYAPLENIKAENKNSIGVIDFTSKEFIIFLQRLPQLGKGKQVKTHQGA